MGNKTNKDPVQDLLDLDQEELGLPVPLLEMEDEDWQEVLMDL